MARSQRKCIHRKTRRGKRAGGKICDPEYVYKWTPKTGSVCSNYYKGPLTPDELQQLGDINRVDDCNDILYWLGSEHAHKFYYCRNGSDNKGKCRARSLRGRGICNNNRDLQTKYYAIKIENMNKQRGQSSTAEQADELVREE